MESKSPENSELASSREVRGESLRPFWAGEWLVEPELNSLRKGDEERHLEPKVMKVLLTLAEHPNHVVSKEDLMAAVWPGTFVGDDVLTRCISVLRRATHDEPSMPRFIQTIPKVGYRLVAEIQEVKPEPLPVAEEESPTSAATESVVAAPFAAERISPVQLLPRSTSRPSRWWMTIAACACILVAAVLGWWRFTVGRDRETFLRTLPFTTQAGEQLQPSFSPDGRTMAYVALSQDGASQHIYMKKIGSEQPEELTSGAGRDFSPAWSPDGRQIAYLSRTADSLGIFILQIGSRQIRRIFVPQQVTHWEQGALSWSPDGKTLVFPDHAGGSSSSAIFALDLTTLQAHALTQPPDGWEGDLTPAFSPDGKHIVFTRASETAIRDLFWVAPAGGELHPLTHDRTNIDSLAWAADSRSVVFSSSRGGKFSLWRIGLRGGVPARMPVGTEDAFQPAISRAGGVTRVAYTQGSAIWSIAKVDTDGNAQPIVSSTQQDSAPSLSPDGGRFAFQSQRSGFQEIWTANADGTELSQLTHQNGPLTGSPSWAHQQAMVLFDSRVNGHSHIFVIPAGGGEARQLTSGEFNDITPRWSVDDNAVFFRSNRGGRWQLWRMDLNTHRLEPLTSDDGIVPQASLDGKWIYYTRGGEGGLWRVAAAGGPETQILPQPAAGYWGFWQVTSHGIVYLDVRNQSLRMYDPTSGGNSLFAHLHRLPPQFAGLTVAPNERSALLTDETDAGRHITLAESDSR